MQGLKFEKGREEKKLFLQDLPRLQRGINLLESDKSYLFHKFVANELRMGKGIWIDQGDNASTFELSKAGGRDILSRIKVSRSYTPYQNYKTVLEAEKILDESFEVLAAPSINLMYEDGQLNQKEREDLFQEVLDRIKGYSENYGLKVLVSFSQRVKGDLEIDLMGKVDKRVKAESNSEGVMLKSQDFSSLAYSRGNSFQTTINLFKQVQNRKEVKKFGEDERYLQAAPRKLL